jgi:hypothetical protein
MEEVSIPKEVRPIGKTTPNYGVIDFIIDYTDKHVVKDKDEKEHMVEVFPIEIQKEHLEKFVQEDPNRWTIKHENRIIEPTKEQVEYAIQAGQVMQLSQSVKITDNYGLTYTLTYNKEEKQYENKNPNIGLLTKLLPLPDAFIDYYQSNDSIRPGDFPNSSRILYNMIQQQLAKMDAGVLSETVNQLGIALDKLTMNVDALRMDVQLLNDRVSRLEGR